MELISGLDAVSLVTIIGTEDLGNVDMIPGLDIVVRRIPSVNVSLDGVALVADDEAKNNILVSSMFFLCVFFWIKTKWCGGKLT